MYNRKIDEIIDLVDRHGEIFFYGMIAGAAVVLLAIALVAMPIS